MTEAEWEACPDWEPMLRFLSGPLTARKARLYLCAAARSLWDLLFSEGSTKGIDVSERRADGQASGVEIRHAEYSAESPSFGCEFEPGYLRRLGMEPRELPTIPRLLEMGVFTEEEFLGDGPLGDEQTRSRLICLAVVVHETFSRFEDGEFGEYCLRALRGVDVWPGGGLVREVFGNPFRPVRLDPGWRTPTLLSLAEAAYEARRLPEGHLDLARLAVLADALEEAGCTDAEILSHLRGPGPHVRGCWVLDCLLGKS